MSDIVTAVYNLMGQMPDNDKVDEEKIKDKVENLFNVSMSVSFQKLNELLHNVGWWLNLMKLEYSFQNCKTVSFT